MKSPFVLFLLPVTLILSISCTKVIHTKQVMQSVHTKDDVLKSFGPPDQTNKIGSDQEWVYFKDTSSRVKIADPAVKIAERPGSVKFSYNKPDSLKTMASNRKNIRFIIDTSNNVIGYKNNGVELTKRVKQNPVLVSLSYLGQTVLILVLFGLSLYIDSGGKP